MGSMLGVILMVGYFAVIGSVSVGGVLLVVNGIQKMIWPLFSIGENLLRYLHQEKLIKKIEKTLENSDTYVETVDLPEFKDVIEFKDVDFSYEDSEQIILSDINFKVKEWEISCGRSQRRR